MVHVLIVAAVPDTAIRANLLEDDCLAGCAERHREKNPIANRDIEGLPQLAAINGSYHAPAQSPFCCIKHDGLGRDAAIAAERAVDVRIAEDDDVRSRTLARRAAVPIPQIPSPDGLSLWQMRRLV